MAHDPPCAPCGCHPGDDDNGWHEHQSDACVQAELDKWAGITDRALALARRDG